MNKEINVEEKESYVFLQNIVIIKGNPWFNIRCEECKRQILSYKNIGIASYFHKDDENPWKTGIAKEVIRYICKRCSDNNGYDDCW